jgi:hypothetical protein
MGETPELTDEEVEPLRCELDNYISRKTMLQVAHFMPEEDERPTRPAQDKQGTAKKARKRKEESSEDDDRCVCD